MENRLKIVLAFLIILFISCGKEPIKEEMVMEEEMEEVSELDYELLWEKVLRKDSLYDSGIIQILQGDKLYYSRVIEGESILAFNEELVCLDKNTGDELWTWHSVNSRSFTEPVVDDNTIAFENNNYYYILDRHTGDEIFASEKLSGGLVLIKDSGINSYVGNIGYGSAPFSHKAQVLEMQKQTGDLDTLVTHLKNDQFHRFISHPILQFNEVGEKILFYFYKKFDWSGVEFHLDFIKYNVDRDSVEWKHADFSNTLDSGGRFQPIILDGNIYVNTVRTVFCFNIETGDEIWRSEHLQTNFSFTNMIINNGILNIHSDTGDLIGIDVETGNLLYKFDYGPTSYEGLTYYDGKIFYATDELIIAGKL